jgi:GTPase SAR1 family protein
MEMDGDAPTSEQIVEQEPQLTLRCKVVLVGDAGVGKTALAQV